MRPLKASEVFEASQPLLEILQGRHISRGKPAKMLGRSWWPFTYKDHKVSEDSWIRAIGNLHSSEIPWHSMLETDLSDDDDDDDDDEDEKFCKFPGRSESTGHPCSWGARTLSCSRTVKICEIWAVFKTLFSYHLLPIPRGKFKVGDLRFYWLVLIPGSGWLNHGSPVIIIRWFSPHNNPIPLWMLSP